MARNPARKPARKPARETTRNAARERAAPGASAAASGPTSERDRIVAAFLDLLAETSIDQISLVAIAKGAGVSLAQLRDAYASPLAILSDHIKAIDRTVLAEDFSDMAEEPPRERLFDVLMRRLEALAPHRDAVRSLLRSARRSPPLALALNRLAVRSQQWMLTAAEIDAAGPRGLARAQGLALLFGPVLRTWVEDEDPGLSRTMAALDRSLARGQRFSGYLDDLCHIPARICRLRSRRRRRRDEDSEDSVAA